MRALATVMLLLLVLVPSAQQWMRQVFVPGLDAELASLDRWRPPTVVKVRDRHGEPFDAFSLVRREWVDLDTLPDHVWQAVIAAEDRRFFEHGGVDAQGILRALWVNVREGGVREGGSTLTQQLVKNVVVGDERTLARKLHEAFLAWRLEGRLGKRRVLEHYVNYVYLGSGNHGVEAAAKDYFGVSAAELNVGQAALLAGLIPAPSRYSPRRNPEVAAERRRLVLDAMVKTGTLDVLDAQWFKKRPVDPPRRVSARGSFGQAYATSVRREIRRLLGTEIPFEAGLQVHTHYDPEIQRVAEQAIEDAAKGIERRQGVPGALTRVSGDALRAYLDEPPGLTREDGAWVAPKPGDCFDAVYMGKQRVALGPFRWWFAGQSWWRRVRTEHGAWPSQPLKDTARWGDVFHVCLDKHERAVLPDTPWVEGAAVVIAHDTGGVVAVVGGREMPMEGFHRATQAVRQAGSSFKPFVYAAALEQGWSQIDLAEDSPMALNAGGGRVWRPRNSSGRYLGRVSLRTAMAYSLNTVSVRLALDVGVRRVAKLARAAGVDRKIREDATMALGSSEVDVLTHAVALSVFPRLGRSMEPVFVSHLVDVFGDEVGRAGAPVALDGVDASLPGGRGERVMASATAWQVLEMMRGVVTQGTGTAAWDGSQWRAGKTGTTTGFADAWFVGFTPTHTIAVWMGRDDRKTLGFNESGARAALPAWRAIADALPKTVEAPRAPRDVVFLPWTDLWVGVDEASVPPERLGWSLPGAAPLADFPGARPEDCEAR